MNYIREQYPPFDLPCGSRAYFDHGSGIGFRCDTCNAMVGSVGMPKECRDLMIEEEQKELIIAKLRGKK